MKVSFCTTCHKRYDTLKKTLNHNLQVLIPGESEIVVVFFNDRKNYLAAAKDFKDAISNKLLRIINYEEDITFKDGSDWSCGYVKHLAHSAALGNVLVNLDADNFIDAIFQSFSMNLKPNEIMITYQAEWKADGRNGRIGIHKSAYPFIYYKDDGRFDDINVINQAVRRGMKVKQATCPIPPLPNESDK